MIKWGKGKEKGKKRGMGKLKSTYAMLLIVIRCSIDLVASNSIKKTDIVTTFTNATKANVAVSLKRRLNVIFTEKLTKATEGHFVKGAIRSNRPLKTISCASKLQVTSCGAYFLQPNNLIMSFVEMNKKVISNLRFCQAHDPDKAWYSQILDHEDSSHNRGKILFALPLTMYWTCPSLQGQAAQKWIRFEGGGTMFPKGANSYIDGIFQSLDVQLREMTAFAQGRLTQDAHSQAGIGYDGGFVPLLKLLELKHGPLQRNAAFALYGLADNEDNVSEFIKGGDVQNLQDGEIIVQATKDCVARTLKRLEENIKGRVLNKLFYLMSIGERVVQRRVHLCSSGNQKTIFIENNGLEFLLGLFASTSPKRQKDGSVALRKLATKATPHSTMNASPLSPTPQGVQLREMAAFALGRLAQDTHNQAGIVYDGGLMPLLKLLESKHGPLQRNAAFALYGLADNEDNVSDFIKVGGVQKLHDGEFIVQATKDCVARTLKRLEEKIKGRVLNHLIYHMRIGEKVVQRKVALALAHLCSPGVQKTVFIDNKGLELLLGLLVSKNPKQQKDGSLARCKFSTNATVLSTMDAASLSPTPKVYLGIQFVNNATLSDVTFLIEGSGTLFNADRITLLTFSDTFTAVLDGGYGATKDCVARTLKRLEEKIKGRVLNHLIYHMRIGEKVVQRKVVLALAHLCSGVQKTVFIDNKGLELLLGLLASSSQKQQKDASVALCKLATKATLHSTMDASPISPTPQVYLGIQFVNSATLSDVTFRIEGGQFHAHIITLLASSDTFRAMLHGGYRGRDARDIEIPNIRLEVFELLVRYIYTGSVDIKLDVGQDLLRAADQCLLDGLKRLCEYGIVI